MQPWQWRSWWRTQWQRSWRRLWQTRDGEDDEGDYDRGADCKGRVRREWGSPAHSRTASRHQQEVVVPPCLRHEVAIPHSCAQVAVPHYRLIEVTAPCNAAAQPDGCQQEVLVPYRCRHMSHGYTASLSAWFWSTLPRNRDWSWRQSCTLPLSLRRCYQHLSPEKIKEGQELEGE